MAERGRPPKPTQLRILQGNPGKRAISPHEARPEPLAKLPPPPRWMSSLAKSEWRRQGKLLIAKGLFTALDHAEFAVYCVSWARWCEAESALERFTTPVMTGAKGGVVRNPYVMISRDAAATMRSAAASFGMTPSSRSRVSVVPPLEVDEFAEMFDSPRRGS